MKTATVTYVAPIGDSKVVEMGGLTFFDGKSVEINDHDNPHLFQKLQGNQYFNYTLGKDAPDTVKAPVKRGRPSNFDKAAAKAAADEADRLAKEAAEKAKEAKATHEELEKEDKTNQPAKAGGSSIFAAPKPGSPASGMPKPGGEPHPMGLTGTSSNPGP
jgi:hypothetical protein